jgi:hypothetical protein
MMDVRYFSNAYQENMLLLQQQTLHELLQDQEQHYRSDVLVIKPVGLQRTMQSKSDRDAGASSFSCISLA